MIYMILAVLKKNSETFILITLLFSFFVGVALMATKSIPFEGTLFIVSLFSMAIVLIVFVAKDMLREYVTINNLEANIHSKNIYEEKQNGSIDKSEKTRLLNEAKAVEKRIIDAEQSCNVTNFKVLNTVNKISSVTSLVLELIVQLEVYVKNYNQLERLNDALHKAKNSTSDIKQNPNYLSILEVLTIKDQLKRLNVDIKGVTCNVNSIVSDMDERKNSLTQSHVKLDFEIKNFREKDNISNALFERTIKNFETSASNIILKLNLLEVHSEEQLNQFNGMVEQVLSLLSEVNSLVCTMRTE